MNALKQLGTAARFLPLATLVLGIGYPLVSFGVGEVIAKHQTQGSIVTSHGRVIGSGLIGQEFAGAQWFHSRPSNAGKGYDPLSSGATNAGPNDATLTSTISARKAAVAKEEGVALSAVPADAITASASGLDPDISLAYAELQAKRVATNNNLTLEQVMAKINAATHHRTLGFLGEDTVNVLRLNASLKG
jgi:K+-transporting ATPase ATPase C chain